MVAFAAPEPADPRYLDPYSSEGAAEAAAAEVVRLPLPTLIPAPVPAGNPVPVPGRRPGRAGAPRSGIKRRTMAGRVVGSNLVRVLAGLILVGAVVFGLVLLNIQLAQNSFELSELRGKAAELEGQQRRLRFEVALAESPDRIAEVARFMGLVPPQSTVFLRVPDGSSEPPVAGGLGD